MPIRRPRRGGMAWPRTVPQRSGAERSEAIHPTRLALQADSGPPGRRRFPEIAREVAEHRAPPARAAPTGPSPYDTLVARNTKLRRVNNELKAQLKLAAAQIQYLALRQAALQAELEAQANITPLTSRFARH